MNIFEKFTTRLTVLFFNFFLADHMFWTIAVRMVVKSNWLDHRKWVKIFITTVSCNLKTKTKFCVGLRCCVEALILPSCRTVDKLLIDRSNVKIDCVIHELWLWVSKTLFLRRRQPPHICVNKKFCAIKKILCFF